MAFEDGVALVDLGLDVILGDIELVLLQDLVLLPDVPDHVLENDPRISVDIAGDFLSEFAGDGVHVLLFDLELIFGCCHPLLRYKVLNAVLEVVQQHPLFVGQDQALPWLLVLLGQPFQDLELQLQRLLKLLQQFILLLRLLLLECIRNLLELLEGHAGDEVADPFVLGLLFDHVIQQIPDRKSMRLPVLAQLVVEAEIGLVVKDFRVQVVVEPNFPRILQVQQVPLALSRLAVSLDASDVTIGAAALALAVGFDTPFPLY